jgi:amidase
MPKEMSTTFISRASIGHEGLTVAVKDLIDLAGFPTTAGSRAVERFIAPADKDAGCLAGLRAAINSGSARIVGKTNLDELAIGATGVNVWFGTPVNPVDPTRVPGGSSSGSASAVAAGEAEVAIGTDAGGSVRIPAACCGIVGLKTTRDRIPSDGVVAVAPSLDTIGPLAADVAGVIRGMELLEPGFSAGVSAHTIGRVRVPDVDPQIDAAIDRALATAEFEVQEIQLPSWDSALDAAVQIALSEAARNLGPMFDRHPEDVGGVVAGAIELGRELTRHEAAGRRFQKGWEGEVGSALQRVEVLAWPTLAAFPPKLADFESIDGNGRTMEINLSGLPALALPVPTGQLLPASLQLVGPPGSEERLVATGRRVEAAVGRRDLV